MNILNTDLVESQLERRTQNIELMDLIMKLLGVSQTDLLAGYYKNDPRNDEINELSELEAALADKIKNIEQSVVNLIKDSFDNYFNNQADFFTYWRYCLLAKHLNNWELIGNSDFEIKNPWDSLENFFKNLDTCVLVFKDANELFEASIINSDEYQDLVSTAAVSYLALSLSSDDPLEHVTELLRLLGDNQGLLDVEISNNGYGSGEYMASLRRLLEEFTGVCLEVPEGCDYEEDAYLENYEWGEAAEKIIEALG